MGHYPCCCVGPCPQIFRPDSTPATIQVDITGNNADNPQTFIVTGSTKDELTFDNFDLSAVLNVSSGGCPGSAGGSSACDVPYPTVSSCCKHYLLAWDEYTQNHKHYDWSVPGSAWIYNAFLSDGRTYPVHKIADLNIYRYEALGQWWAVVKGYVQVPFYNFAIMWRGAAQIGTTPITAGTYSVPLDLSCSTTNGDDGTYPGPIANLTTGVTAAGTATITVF